MIAPVEYRHLVLPLDGSLLAELAVPWTRLIAQKTHAEVDLVTSFQREADLGALDHDASESHQWVEQELRRWGVQSSRHILPGDPSTVIEARARERRAELIVMATHGRSGVSRRILGSVTDRVLRVSSVPVLVIRVDPSRNSTEPAVPDTIVLPLDGSETSESAVPVAAGLSALFCAKLLILHCLSREPVAQLTGPAWSVERSSEDSVAWAADQLRTLGLSADVSYSSLEPKTAILDACEAAPNSIVVMASMGATGIGRSRRGSVADHVIRHATVPVVVVPPRGYLGPILD